VIPGLNEFVAEFVSEGAMATGGYLEERGLTPLAADILATEQANATGAVNMTAPEK
jgi:phosphate transport system substrate-binding protein